MEILTIILSGLLSLGSSGGIILDRVVRGKIASQVMSVEQHALRIDNQPNYQVAQGKLSRVRFAGRGVKIQPGLKIAVVDLETDPISLNLSDLDLKSIDRLRTSLVKPATGMIRLVFTEQDLNQFLQSPEILAQLQTTLNRLLVRKSGSTNISYQLSDLHLELLTQNRLEAKFKLSRPRPAANFETDEIAGTSDRNNRSRELDISLILTIELIKGKKIRLVNPQGTVNGRPMSSRLLMGFAEGISDRFDLSSLSADGILTRILQLEIDEDKLVLVSFVRLETKTQQSSTTSKVFP